MIFSSLSIVITTKDYTKDLKGSYYNLDVLKVKIWPSKCAAFVFYFEHNLVLIYTLCYVPKIGENIG